MEKKESQRHSSTGDVLLRIVAILTLGVSGFYAFFQLENSNDENVINVASTVFIFALAGVCKMVLEATQKLKKMDDDSHSKEGD